MKTLRVLPLVMVLAGCSQMSGHAGRAPIEKSLALAPRESVRLDGGWKFHLGELAGVAEAAKGTGEWTAISLPHTWNALDGQDGGTPYFRGDGWYVQKLEMPGSMAGKKLYLRFEGANRRSEVFVNGTRMGGHVGGTQAFVVDVTSATKAGANQLVVHVDNKVDPDSAPLKADFTFCGGIYRAVSLIAVEPVHISLTDFGSPGVFISTPTVTDSAATVHVKSMLQNESGALADAVIRMQVMDAGGKVVAETTTPAGIGAGVTQEVAANLTVNSPHRWNGRIDPYLYSVKTSVVVAGKTVDVVTQPLGIRTFSVDPQRGFILNGKPYALHGVDRHQEWQDKGWALSEENHRTDMALIKEMGCTAIRLAHYQHSDFFYELCDKEGMVVWAEIPVVDALGSSKAFTENAQQQYRELIRQNFNHPSIAFWSAGNEVEPPAKGKEKDVPEMYGWFKTMSEIAHTEDPGRISTAAYRGGKFPPIGTTDVWGLNIYMGWYSGGYGEVPGYIVKHEKDGASGKWAISEYGAGSSVYFHSEHPVRMDHTEEYQATYHENNWKVLKEHPEIWGKFVWCMFDFGSDGRSEGDHAGMNDKGLVTHDRAVKKDAFYFYKANWSSEPTVHIASKRFAVRGVPTIDVKVYSNAPTVGLTVDGKLMGEKASNGNGVFLWEGVALKEGANAVEATGVFASGKAEQDKAVFTYTPRAPEEVYVGQDEQMRKALMKGPPRAK